MVRPVRRHVSGVRGSVSVFPSRAFEQAAALCDAANPKTNDGGGDRRLDERAFLLWWAARPIVHDPRRLLLRFSDRMIQAVEHVRSIKGTPVIGQGAEDSDAAFDTVDALFQQHPPEHFVGPLFRAFFKNVSRKPENLVSVMIAMATAAVGSMPLFESSHRDGEASLAMLVLQAFGFSEFEREATAEEQVERVLGNVGLYADRMRITEFVLHLRDDELETARRCARAFLEGLPPIVEVHALLFGKRGAARILSAYSRLATTHFKAASVVGAAWLLHQEGSANVVHFIEQIEEAAPKAKALCTLARAFPGHTKLLSPKNAERLAALPEETRQQMLDILRPAMT